MDDRYGDRDNQWRDRSRARHYQQRGGFGRDHDHLEPDGRGFMERAGEEVRSWFGDDDGQQRGRDGGQRGRGDQRWQNDRGATGYRRYQAEDHGDPDGSAGYQGTASGWGNQAGDSWNRERPGSHGAYGAYGAGGQDERSRDGHWAGRSGAMGRDHDQGRHDPHYSEWRNRQIESIDRDYEEYRREHQSKFEQDFGNWRTRRGEQRQSMTRVTEHMEVFGSDGEKIGTVDAVQGDRIKLAKNDENAGGHHHSIPCSWIEKVEDRVTVNKTRDEAMRQWRDEERSRALNESEHQGSDGPHVLNRSFRGTY